MIYRKLVLYLTFFMFSLPLGASEISYSNFSINYVDVQGFKGNGASLSKELGENVFITWSTTLFKSDKKILGKTGEIDVKSLGIGYRSSINETSDFVLSAEYIDPEADSLPIVVEDGLVFTGMIRSMTSDVVELNTGFKLQRDGDESHFGLIFGAANNITDSLALTASYLLYLDAGWPIEGEDIVSLGVRYNF